MSWHSLKRGPKPMIKLTVIDSYQTFHDTGGQSVKSCYGLKYNQRTDLEISFKDENNEFQYC